MIRGFPDSTFVGVHGIAIRPHHFIHSVEFIVDLLVLDEVPPQLEGLEVNVGLAPDSEVNSAQDCVGQGNLARVPSICETFEQGKRLASLRKSFRLESGKIELKRSVSKMQS